MCAVFSLGMPCSTEAASAIRKVCSSASQIRNRRLSCLLEIMLWMPETCTDFFQRPAQQKLHCAMHFLLTSAGTGLPVRRMTDGVIRAATPHPNFLKMIRESSIMMKVTAPVLEEKSPIKEEYSLGFGNCILILLFQVTSTKLILIP